MNQRPNPLTPPSGRRPIYIAALLFLIFTASLLLYRGVYRAIDNSADFGLYYCSTVSLIQGNDPYTPSRLHEIAQSRGVLDAFMDNAIAPPFSYVPIIPFALLPWPAAKVLWLVFNLACAAALFYWLGKLAGIPMSARCTTTLFWAGCVFGFAPLQTCVSFGQLAVVSSAACAGALFFEQRNTPLLTAALWTLAGLLKPQIAAALLLYFLYRRQWRIILATFIGGSVITLLAAGWLQLNDPAWYGAWADNVYRLTHGGASDFARPKSSYIFSNLQVPIYILFGSKAVANASAWGITLALGAFALWRLRLLKQLRSSTKSVDSLGLAALCITLGLIPFYHVYYDHTALLVTAAWAIGKRVANSPNKAWIYAILLVLLPMFLPGQVILNLLAHREVIPVGIGQNALFRAFVIAQLPWLTLILGVLLIPALRNGVIPSHIPDKNPTTS